MKDSYIKTHNPDMYRFFMDYWDLISKFWIIDTDNEHYYNCLTSDMLYYTRKYDRKYFYSNLLFAVYDHCYNDVEECMPLNELKAYLGDLWAYMNETYEISEAEEKSSNDILPLTEKIKDKYRGKDFCIKLIDYYLSWRFPDLAQAA